MNGDGVINLSVINLHILQFPLLELNTETIAFWAMAIRYVVGLKVIWQNTHNSDFNSHMI